MLRLTITTTIPSKKTGGNIWFNFETDYPDLPSVHTALVRDGSIFGYRVTTVETEGGKRIATARTPHIVGAQAVGTICPVTTVYDEAA